MTLPIQLEQLLTKKSAYEIDGELKITNPGEIIIPDNLFYSVGG